MLYRKSLSYACAVLALSVSAGSALAADLPPPPPPPVTVIEEEGSCFYVNVGASYVTHERPNVYKNAAGPWLSPNALGEDMNDTGAVDWGVGCRVIENVRVEFNAGYRFESRLVDGFNSLDADVSTFTGMTNVWWDIYDLGGWKPYIGGGIGVAVHTVDSSLPAGSTGNRTTANFTWQVGAGVGIDVTDNLTVDLGYRFTDLGRPQSAGATPFYIDDFYSHEFRIGLRYDFDGIF
ncbi:MAG: acyloxyacyl hydrolase [Pseudomonadota bacterium]